MDLTLPLVRYAHALGRWQAAWRFASPELRRAVALGQIAAAWTVFRRDAGTGAVGPAYEETVDRGSITCTDDSRRDRVLLWLADTGAPAIAEAAGLLSHMIGATSRFGGDEQELLRAPGDTLGGSARPGPIARLLPPLEAETEDVLAPLWAIAVAVDELRANTNFLESSGGTVRHRLPSGTISHYVPAEPAATWALNLALLTSGLLPAGVPPVPGLVSRALFQADRDPEELMPALIDGVTGALTTGYTRIGTLRADLDRGNAAMSHMSRNSRSRDAWLLTAALGTISRTQLGRGLGLSRAGADIQARALAAAGLVKLAPAGRIDWQPRPAKREPARLHQGPRSEGAAELDAKMAEIDRLLARTAR